MSYALEELHNIKEKLEKMRENGDTDLLGLINYVEESITFCEDDENN